MENNSLSPGEKPASSTFQNTCTHVKVNVVKLSHTLTISNFSFCSNQTCQALKSQVFSDAGNDDLKWLLKLFPRGNSEKVKDYVSLYLHLLSNKTDIKIATQYKFVIYNDKMEEGICKKLECVFTKPGGCGFPEFVKRDHLLNIENKLLPDDNLTICCEITFARDTVYVSGQECCQESKKSKEIQNPLKKLEFLFDQQEFSDIQFIVAPGGRAFKAHKAILAASSSVFLAMFKSGMEETKRNCIDINDMDAETVEEMLRFVYTGKVTNIKKIAASLLFAADKYALDELKQICAEQLWQSLTVENASSVLILADRHNANWLKARVINFIISQITNVIESADFKSMVVSHPHLFALLQCKKKLMRMRK